MSYIGDLSTYFAANSAAAMGASAKKGLDGTTNGLDMTDFLTLMVAQFQNQSIDNQADTTDMLNQLVQMQMVQALTTMTDASVMSYAASLVGKDVTVLETDMAGNTQEIIGTVTATGTYGGEQVVFIDDKYYYLSEIMAVGRLPQQISEENGANSGDNTNGNTNTGAVSGTETPNDQTTTTPAQGMASDDELDQEYEGEQGTPKENLVAVG